RLGNMKGIKPNPGHIQGKPREMLQAKDNPESSLTLQELKSLEGFFKCEAVLAPQGTPARGNPRPQHHPWPGERTVREAANPGPACTGGCSEQAGNSSHSPAAAPWLCWKLWGALGQQPGEGGAPNAFAWGQR
uniref:Uncharacterized protein n=1 Tax=Amazona collaria TaxID=241587 RepID=A0A8B9F5U2_9PSIT